MYCTYPQKKKIMKKIDKGVFVSLFLPPPNKNLGGREGKEISGCSKERKIGREGEIGYVYIYTFLTYPTTISSGSQPPNPHPPYNLHTPHHTHKPGRPELCNFTFFLFLPFRVYVCVSMRCCLAKPHLPFPTYYNT